jgi:CHAD domain-containing protein
LPLAAEKADDDPEHVHELRVWTRRAGAAFRLYQDLMPRRQLLWMTKQLKRIRHSANNARDLDVLIKRLGTQQQMTRGQRTWLAQARADRNRAQKAIVAVYDRLRHKHRFERRIEKVLRPLREQGRGRAGTRFGVWAVERLRPLVRKFFAVVPTNHNDERALHQFRIRGKELRYAIELLAGAFPPALRDTIYREIETIQDRLGVLNDLATSRDRLLQKTEKARDDRAELRRLLANEESKLQRTRTDFWEWCTPDFLQALRDQFQSLFSTQPLMRRRTNIRCDNANNGYRPLQPKGTPLRETG